MANNYRKRAGDRADGRRIRSLDGFFTIMPYIMPDKNDALNYFDQSFEITNAEHWFRQQRTEGYKGMGMLYLIIAAYVRAVAALPAINRFVVGRRIFAHKDIDVVLAVKRSITLSGSETTVKIRLSPSDTIYDVYRKVNRVISEVKSSDDANGTEEFANSAAKMPRFLMRFVMWIIKVLDYFGWLPKKLIDISPFHGSMIITDLGSLGISPVYHHIYNFGTLPVFISFGAKRKAYELDKNGTVCERRYVDMKFTTDERIVDGHYYATFLKLMSSYIADPSLLEVPPDTVKQDIF